MKSVTQLYTKIRSWCKAEVSKQPLSMNNAYSLSSIGTKKSLDELLILYQDKLLKEIKYKAKFYETSLYHEYEPLVCEAHKCAIKSFLIGLGYNIKYADNECILISWKIK